MSSAAPAAGTPAPGPRHAPPALFGVLVMPFGLAVGYAQVAVPFILHARGVPLETIAGVSALSLLPHGWKFLWAPALDTGWRRRSWYLGSVAVTGAALALTALIPPDSTRHIGSLSLLTVYAGVLALAQAAVATSSAAVDALMAITLPQDKKGAAAGWSMAGNLGGTGLGGALALWLSQHMATSATAILLGATCVACGLPALRVHETPPEKHALGAALAALVKDVWLSVRSREGWTGLLICMMPVGTGAATNLFSAFAKDYGAGEGQVELVNGVLGGLVGAAGCLVGGFLADRMNRRICYVMAGAFTASVALTMALTRATPTTFTVGCLAYAFCNGIAYAAFAAFVLEMVGHGQGVTTKYALYVGVSNQAISYVTWLDGKGYAWGGRSGLLGTDALASVAGIAVLTAAFLLLRSRSRARPAEPARS
jgi:MFS family permease